MAVVVVPVAGCVPVTMNQEKAIMSETERTPRLPRRREFLTAGLGVFIVAAVPFARRDRRRIVRRTMPVMATTAEFTVVHTDTSHAERAIDAAMAELSRVERLMTRFQATSDIGRVNASAALAPVLVSGLTYTVVDEALRWAAASNGAFDPGVGRVVELWDVAHRHEPPPDAALRPLRFRHFYRHVQVGTERGQPAIYLASQDIHLDLGGIACGFGVDRAIESLRQWGIRDALLNVSGDIYALGHAPDGSPWRIGVRSPTDPSALIGQVEVSDKAVATSGDYEQFFMYRGVRYQHLMDPDAAAPRRTPVRTVTVVADRCVEADAASTAVFGMPEVEARRLLSARAPGAYVVSEA
jgi:FAD:protein FMN transferase